jgi:alpha-D-ribose 1-methylphosphonate 5-triphosphate synthase subunit PhnH
MIAMPSGFGHAVLEAQAAFRALMEATARPGRVERITGLAGTPAPLSSGAAALALTLADHDTPVWLDPDLATAEVAAWLKFHTAAPIVADPARAAFAFIADPERAPSFDTFALGTAEYPDRSTTVILQVASFDHGRSLLLSGPGIRGSQPFVAAPLPEDMVERLAANRALFPRGVDLVLVTDDAIAAIPRSTHVMPGG